MPQPWPAVSPVHTKLWTDDGGRSPPVRPLPLVLPASGAVRKLPVTVSPAAPPSSSKLISRANRVLAGRWPAWILAVKSDAWVARGPRRVRAKAPRPFSTAPLSSTALRVAIIRPAAEERDQSTAESEVTSPVAMPLGRVSRFLTRGIPVRRGLFGTGMAEALAAAGTAASAAARTELLTIVRREISVMAPTVHGARTRSVEPG